MIFRQRPFNRTMFLGLALLVQANIARLVLERHPSMSEDLRDGLVGLLFGLAIGCLLLGLWRMNHPHKPTPRA